MALFNNAKINLPMTWFEFAAKHVVWCQTIELVGLSKTATDWLSRAI